MKKAAKTGGTEKLVEIIRYLHQFPFAGTREITKACKISEAQFFRHRINSARLFGLRIEFKITRKRRGHTIADYGIINKNKL